MVGESPPRRTKGLQPNTPQGVEEKEFGGQFLVKGPGCMGLFESRVSPCLRRVLTCLVVSRRVLAVSHRVSPCLIVSHRVSSCLIVSHRSLWYIAYLTVLFTYS